MATESAADEWSNLWHSPRTVQTTRRIMDLCEHPSLQGVVRFVAVSLVNQPERERRLLSHFGFIQGLDWGNIVYAITYRKLLEYASPRCPYMNYARNFSNPNNCGNLIEAVLAIADLAPQVYHGEKGSRDLEVLLFQRKVGNGRRCPWGPRLCSRPLSQPILLQPSFPRPLGRTCPPHLCLRI